ncbi:MAG: hypothetical protein ACOX51_07140 [Myxococcota bacterium]
MAEDPDYFDWVLEHYLGIDDIPQPLIASLFELGYDFMVQSRGAMATVDFGLTTEKAARRRITKESWAPSFRMSCWLRLSKNQWEKTTLMQPKFLISLHPI